MIEVSELHFVLCSTVARRTTAIASGGGSQRAGHVIVRVRFFAHCEIANCELRIVTGFLLLVKILKYRGNEEC